MIAFVLVSMPRLNNVLTFWRSAILAYVFGRLNDEAFLQLKKLLEPFGVKRFCTDGWGAYQRHLPAQMHEGLVLTSEKFWSLVENRR